MAKKGVNPTLKYILGSNKVIVNIVLIVLVTLLSILIVVSAIAKWIDKDVVLNVAYIIIGAFLGVGLSKYAKQR